MFRLTNRLLSLAVERTAAAGLLFRFFSRILPVPTITVRAVPIQIIIPLNQHGTFDAFKHWETREPETLDWIDSWEKDCTFFDIGASFGNETLYAALKKNGPQKIIAVDLDFLSSFNLANNLQLNGVRHVDQYYLAISSHAGFIATTEHTNYACVPGRPKYNCVEYKTWSLSLDELAAQTQAMPDYVKIDVDGAEDKVVAGMRDLMRSQPLKSVLIEVADQTRAIVTQAFLNAGFDKHYESELRGGKIKTSNIIFRRHV